MQITKIKIIEACENKEALFEIIAKEFKEKNIIKLETEFVKALKTREAEVSTGFVDGFAIPHGKSETVVEPGIIFLRINDGIDWPSMDGGLIHHVFALAIPEVGGEEHLKTLTKISRKLVDEQFRDNLKLAENNDDIAKLLTEVM